MMEKKHTCVLCYNPIEEGNLHNNSVVFYFLSSVYWFCLFVVFIERLMLLFIFVIRGEIALPVNACNLQKNYVLILFYFSFSHVA